MAKDVILKKGDSIRKKDISEMRERIINELSDESDGMDIKLGPGGIEEIEFQTQFLQLHYAQRFPDFLVQNTMAAAGRLAKKEVFASSDKDIFNKAYKYFRKLETFLRLNEEQTIKDKSDFTELSAKFMGHKSEEEFLDHLRRLRKEVLSVINE